MASRSASRPPPQVHPVHSQVNAQGQLESEEVDVDARPSDTINLAVRFGVSTPGAVRLQLTWTAVTISMHH